MSRDLHFSIPQGVRKASLVLKVISHQTILKDTTFSDVVLKILLAWPAIGKAGQPDKLFKQLKFVANGLFWIKNLQHVVFPRSYGKLFQMARHLGTISSAISSWWSEGENFQESVVAKVFLVKLSEARTVTLEQLVVMSSPLNLL